jgi:hypothetical protein
VFAVAAEVYMGEKMAAVLVVVVVVLEVDLVVTMVTKT